MIPLSVPNLKGNESKYLRRCVKTEFVSSVGQFVKLFEKKISKFTKSKYSVACTSGTGSIHLALKVIGCEQNDEVIVPTITFAATVNPIVYEKARPIFMDCDKYYTIDVDKTVDFLNKKTRTIKKKISGNNLSITINKKTGNRIAAIIAVHIFGNAVKLDKLFGICKKKNITLIEDAAESLGTFYKSGKFKKRHTGTIGAVGCLSFNGNKIITSGGGGMILTNNWQIAKKARYLTTQAKDDPIYSIHNEVGYNFRLTNIHAALGVAQLETISKYIKKKKIIHERYKKKINKIKDLFVSNTSHYAKCNYWLNILEIKKNLSKKKLSKIIKYLDKSGIEVRPFWHPNHLQKKYKNCQKYKLDNVNKVYQNRLCLPSSPQLTAKQQDFICKKLKNIF